MAKKSFKKNATLFKGESNPFNIKVNRRKHTVLNSKVKGTKGLPGVSKAISHAKRKDCWQKSRISTQKSNRYFDKRLLDPSMPLEDQVTARFVRERQKKVKKNIFNLNDEEELTHKGQPLQNMNNFDDNESGSEEDEERLGASFVKKAHFGGFASESNFENPKSHKELIDQLILESKQKKQERKMEKEKYVNSQEIVDKEWKEIHLMRTVATANSNSTPHQSKVKPPPVSEAKDIYDLSKVELKFEPKGSSISHTKTPEQLAEEEEKLKAKLEQERLLRMIDDSEFSYTKPDNHLSADGIVDYFDYLQPVPIEENSAEVQSAGSEGEEDSDSDKSLDSKASPSEQNGENCDIVPELEEDLLSDEDKGIASNIPGGIENFRTQVKDCDAEEVYEVISKILGPTIRSKKEKVLAKLGKFFGILIQYALECCEGNFNNVDKTGVLLPHLHSLATVATSSAAEKFLNVLDQEQQIFQDCQRQNMKRNFPRLQTLVVLKYSVAIYSVSDFRHPVVTPAMILMCDILSSKFCATYANILSRLLVSKLAYDCVADSKRFFPEAINFLNDVLQLAAPGKKKGKNEVPNYKKFNLILVGKALSDDIAELNLLQSNKSLTEEDKKVGIISEVVNQLHQFSSLYTHLPSYQEIFYKTTSICSELPSPHYPPTLQKSIQCLSEITQKNVSLHQLVFQNTKPKPLKMFEPSFDSKFCPIDDISKKRKLLTSVSQKIRKEEKGMLREIRRDARMIASEKMKEKLELDAERKRKVKELFGELAMQEGEFKKMLKKKS